MSALRVDRIEPTSDRDLADAAGLETVYWREVLGDGEPEFPPGEFRDVLLHVHRDDIDATGLIARDGDHPVGFAVVDIRSGMGNDHMAWVPDLYVAPTDRRQGAGRALLDEVCAIARAAGRTLVIGGYPDGHEGGIAFTTAVGAEHGHREAQSRLRLDDLDRALMERWVDAAQERATGYSLLAFDDVCPDDLLDAFVRLQHVMNTAPRPDALDEFVFTAQRRRAAEAERAAVGAHQWVLCVRHDDTGDLAGYTEISFGPHRPWLGEQGDTAVDPVHRNKGLGRWLKAVNALRVLAERPDVAVLETWNDGTNAPMLGINTEMGFRRVAVWRDGELTLSGGTAATA